MMNTFEQHLLVAEGQREIAHAVAGVIKRSWARLVARLGLRVTFTEPKW